MFPTVVVPAPMTAPAQGLSCFVVPLLYHTSGTNQGVTCENDVARENDVGESAMLPCHSFGSTNVDHFNLMGEVSHIVVEFYAAHVVLPFCRHYSILIGVCNNNLEEKQN